MGKWKVKVDGSFAIGFVWSVPSLLNETNPALTQVNKSKGAIFSIDGTFAGSKSLSAFDPKVRPGSVDLVRFWKNQQQVLCIYITARPAMQKDNIENWLSRHNFPHGPILFADQTTSMKKVIMDYKNNKLNLLYEIRKKIEIVACYGSDKDKDLYLKIRDPNLLIIGIHTYHKVDSNINNNSRSGESLNGQYSLNDNEALVDKQLRLDRPRISSESNAQYLNIDNNKMSTSITKSQPSNLSLSLGARSFSHTSNRKDKNDNPENRKVVMISNGYTNHILDLENRILKEGLTSPSSSIGSGTTGFSKQESCSLSQNMRLLMSPYSFASVWRKEERRVKN